MEKINILTTAFNSEKNIVEFITQINLTMKKNQIKNFKLIIVDDGSNDNTVNKIKEFKKLNSDIKIKLIVLTKNYGHHPAYKLGLKYCSGEYIFLIDSDLQEKPADLIFIYKMLVDEKLDALFTFYKKNNNFLSVIFYKIISKLFFLKINQNMMTLRVFTKKYCKFLNGIKNENFILSRMVNDIGLKYKFLEREKLKPKYPSNYSLSKRATLAFDHFLEIGDNFYLNIFIMIFLTILIMIGLILRILINYFNAESVFNSGFTTLSILIIFFGISNLFLLVLILIMNSRLLKYQKNNENIFVSEEID